MSIKKILVFIILFMFPITVMAFPTTAAKYVLPKEVKLYEKIFDFNLKEATKLDSKALIYFKKLYNEPTADGTVLLSDSDKVAALCGWFDENIAYDYLRAKKIENGDIVNANAMYAYKNKKGVCSDMAYLFYAILRANGVEVVIKIGTMKETGIGHAWNAYYDDVIGKWISIDLANMNYNFKESRDLDDINVTAVYSSQKHGSKYLSGAYTNLK